MKLVLFDIDGTLLWTDGAGRRAIRQALLDEAGTAGPIESYRFDGKTDPQIVRELLALAAHPPARDEAPGQAGGGPHVGLLAAPLGPPPQRAPPVPGGGRMLAPLAGAENPGGAPVR